MSKIKYWDEQTQSWVIAGASNAANIELTNPAYLDENGDSISVDLGFTKVVNRITKVEKNLAWIYQNGAIGGGGGGGGGTDSTAYSILVAEGSRVYTATTSIDLHITIQGGSLKKEFLLEVSNASTGERLLTTKITSLESTLVTIKGLNDSTQTLKISAHTGLYYASDFILTVVAGAIKLSRTNIPQSLIYPTTSVYTPVLIATNSTDSDLRIIAEYTKDEINYIKLQLDLEVIEKTSLESYTINLPEVSRFLEERALEDVGETYKFNIYALGVLNDNVLTSNVISFNTTIIAANTLYILTYGINKVTPSGLGDLELLNKFVYGQNVQFDYELSFSNNNYPIYNIDYEVCPCYFEDGILVHDSFSGFTGRETRISKGVRSIFSFSTASLPIDTIYDVNNNEYKFIRLTMTATSVDDPTITDTRVVYFTLSHAVEKYITATNFDRSLICYYSPVLGVPTGNAMTWTYDNQNTLFTYSRLGIVRDRYIPLTVYNSNGIRNGYDTQGMHLTGKAYALLGLNLFSAQSNEVNLLNGNGFSISLTFRTDANIDSKDHVMSLGKYNGDELTAGIEILAEQVRVLVNRQATSLNITKGDLTTIDLVFEKYVGVGDTNEVPNHWFVKIYLNGVLSSLSSQDNSYFMSNLLGNAWYFEDLLCIGARLKNGEVVSSASVHVYDFKVYSSALSDNEIIQNYISSTIYSQLPNGESPSFALQADLLAKNFILMGTEGDYESLLFDLNNPREYKDPDTLLNTLRAALADSKIPYPIVVINLVTPNSNFYGTTLAQFSEDQKAIVTGQEYRYPISMDYYTAGNSAPIKISNSDRMKISIQGTSSLQFVSKNYEIYMGQDDQGKDVLVQMREDWLPENEFTLKADVMDSAHINNVLIGKIINGLVTTTDSSGNTVPVRPLDNTPPMNVNNAWASKIKHTSEGYPVILFINFRNSDNSTVCRCQGIYNFNLGRAASFNLGLKLLTSCTFVDNAVAYPRMVESYEESLVISNGAPVYSIEVGENNQLIGAFDQGSVDIVQSGIFDTIYASDGAAQNNLLSLLTFLASFGADVSNPKKTQVDGLWCTPEVVKVNNEWTYSGRYYYPMNRANYTQNVLEMHMSWNNLVAYYIIAIVFGLVDSMGKNLTLRTWNTVADENGRLQCVWYMCFYDMDTAMRLDNDGNETVPYNAHLNRYYTEHSGPYSEARVQAHASSISGLFTLVYSSPNTRFQEIAENIVAEENSKTLRSVYANLRSMLFPDPGAFIDKYYTGQINEIGAALYNYDYKLKYLQTKKQYSVSTGELVNSNDYNQLSYLHGNGSTNIKSWFKRRVRFLDGIYGVNTDGNNTIEGTGITDLTLASSWTDNNATYTLGKDPTIVSLQLQAESQTLINIAAGTNARVNLWVDENVLTYKVRNVTGTMRYSFYGNDILTTLDGFEKFHWISLNSLEFPRIKKLSLRNLKEVNDDGFLVNQAITDLESLIELDLSGFTLLNNNSQVVYKRLDFISNLPSLEVLDISGSSFNDIVLPESGVLKYLDLSDTRITSINFSGQPMLETLNLSNCVYLEYISLTNCPKLKSLSIPNGVKTVFLADCPGLESVSCPFYKEQVISPLESLTVSACEGLKTINLSGQNNPSLQVHLVGAPNLEDVLLNRIVTTNIIFPNRNRWSTLKTLDIGNTAISRFNFDGEYSTYLDLSNFPLLHSINLENNFYVQEVRCPNIEGQYIELSQGSMYGCSSLRTLVGNFMIVGNRVFQNCNSLLINSDTRYAGVDYTSTYIPGNFCNITFYDGLSSYSEMFSGCSSISGQDFRYIMDKVKPAVTDLSKMFQGCLNAKAELWNDMFSKCPYVRNLTSFCDGAGVRGSFYSTKGDKRGLLSYLTEIENISLAFSNSGIDWIDDDAFKDCSTIEEADSVFMGCYNLKSCEDTYNPSLGYLHSKTFFTNLSGLIDVFPERMFYQCSSVYMLIDSEELPNGVMFDYLFHYDKDRLYNGITLTDSLYSGINLVGEIHANVFGGIVNTDGEYNIPNFRIISNPFIGSGTLLRAKLNELGDLFKNLSPTSLIGTLQGINFYLDTTNHIPNNIFEGCSDLLSISGFFANETITNNGDVYEFPTPELFRDCTKLQNVSNLFSGDKYLDISLLGGGFINSPILNFSGMLLNSGVFGMIPYKFLRTNGKTITTLANIFKGCFKLGYTRDRTIDEGTPYQAREMTLYTHWEDAVISVPGTPVYFELDRSGSPDSEYYIDGRIWPQAWRSSAYYDSEVENYDIQQLTALSNTMGRTPNCYLNYMFPADLFYSCSDTCTMGSALAGLSYNTYSLVDTEIGTKVLEFNKRDGLKGRLPMKLFKNNSGITMLETVFTELDFCPFVGFRSDIYDTLKLPASQARGIKLPPDLFAYTPNIETLRLTFMGISIEAGVDINLNFGYLSNLRDITMLLANVQFNDYPAAGDTLRANDPDTYLNGSLVTYPLLSADSFANNHELRVLQGLFAVTDTLSVSKGLLHVTDTMFQPESELMHPYISDVSSMFYNNRLLSGSIPLMNGSYITQFSAYVEGVNKSSITNAAQFMDLHSDAWIPTTWKI